MNNIVGDMIIRIQNGYNAKKTSIIAKKTINSISILNILYDEGYIRGYKHIDNNNIEILLKYINNNPSIKKITIISKPGRRVYYSLSKLKLLSNNSLMILYTSKGVLSFKKALEERTGGEVLFEIV